MEFFITFQKDFVRSNKPEYVNWSEAEIIINGTSIEKVLTTYSEICSAQAERPPGPNVIKLY